MTVGEFIAFLIGWNLILEYAIGSASVAKGITNYIDTLPYVDKAISKFFNDIVPLGGGGNSYFGDYADFFALGLIVVLSCESLIPRITQSISYQLSFQWHSPLEPKNLPKFITFVST